MAFTLDDIHDAAQKKYADTELDIKGEQVILVNALRLSKEKRKKFTDAAKELEVTEDEEGNEVEVDMEAFLRKTIRAVAKTGSQADTLLEEIGDDVAAMLAVFDLYKNKTDLGEASASQD